MNDYFGKQLGSTCDIARVVVLQEQVDRLPKTFVELFVWQCQVDVELKLGVTQLSDLAHVRDVVEQTGVRACTDVAVHALAQKIDAKTLVQ